MQTVQNDPTIIAPTFKHLKASFRSEKTFDINFRKQQLRNLIRGLDDLSEKFASAMEKDLGASKTFTLLSNTSFSKASAEIALKEIDSWVKPIPVDTPLLLAPAKSYMQPEPLGVVLIIGAWNYPLSVAFPYFVAAIAAGNCMIFKPSELAPNVSAVFVELFQYLDSDFYRCIEGEVEVAQAIIKQPFDLIVFTGSPQKARDVAAAAAANLTPCIMELGGKCPTVVNKEADLENAALRVARARFMNVGQTCIACDYVFVHREIKAKFMDLLVEKVKQFYGEDAFKSADYSRIINTRHTERVKSYLDENHGGKVIIGGTVKVNERYVAPTIIDSPRPDSKMMQDEIFGPILPVYEFGDIEEVIDFINDRPKPLAAYYYGSAKSEDFNQFKQRTSSGALACNDSFTQVINYHLPFGGVGESGMGKLNGVHAFKSMTHMKSVFEANTNNSFPKSALFPPYTETTQKVAQHGMNHLLHLKQKNDEKKDYGNVFKYILAFIVLLIAYVQSEMLLKLIK